MTRTGAFAEYATIGQGAIARVPEYLSDEEAASVPLTALTAMQALALMKPKKGETISWRFVDGRVRYEITAEMPVTICVNGTKKDMEPGKYTFWG